MNSIRFEYVREINTEVTDNPSKMVRHLVGSLFERDMRETEEVATMVKQIREVNLRDVGCPNVERRQPKMYHNNLNNGATRAPGVPDAGALVEVDYDIPVDYNRIATDSRSS